MAFEADLATENRIEKRSPLDISGCTLQIFSIYVLT